MIVHLLDGTYELFRHFYGLRRVSKGADPKVDEPWPLESVSAAKNEYVGGFDVLV